VTVCFVVGSGRIVVSETEPPNLSVKLVLSSGRWCDAELRPGPAACRVAASSSARPTRRPRRSPPSRGPRAPLQSSDCPRPRSSCSARARAAHSSAGCLKRAVQHARLARYSRSLPPSLQSALRGTPGGRSDGACPGTLCLQNTPLGCAGAGARLSGPGRRCYGRTRRVRRRAPWRQRCPHTSPSVGRCV
jgi:hypothetical protein